ncbi:MAG: hypothetical protein ACFFB3_16905 [Candidatus Hodarchaeota archaeon]
MSTTELEQTEGLIMLHSNLPDHTLEARIRWHRFIAQQRFQKESLNLADFNLVRDRSSAY